MCVTGLLWNDQIVDGRKSLQIITCFRPYRSVTYLNLFLENRWHIIKYIINIKGLGHAVHIVI